MFKKIFAIVSVLLMLSSSQFSFAESHQITPHVGGSNSHDYYYYSSYIVRKVSRSKLVSLKIDLENRARKHQTMLNLINGLSGSIPYGWVMSVPLSKIEDSNLQSANVIENSLLADGTSNYFDVCYEEYRCEVPGSAYIKVVLVEKKIETI
ncbi:MAG: hypothetical protein Q4A75_01625 [Peptostreptococcaceae bacterium]|nr:hypothetical protein [Peptostreptococcaceae bacterium]